MQFCPSGNNPESWRLRSAGAGTREAWAREKRRGRERAVRWRNMVGVGVGVGGVDGEEDGEGGKGLGLARSRKVG